MGFYYDVRAAQTTNGSVDTENQAARLLTVANQRACLFRGAYIACRETSAGGVFQRIHTMTTPGSVGSAYTPGPRHPEAPAAETTAFTAHTVGTTAKERIVIGAAATGGMGLWVALSDAHAIALVPNGGATGNLEATNIAGVASVDHDWVWEFEEI